MLQTLRQNADELTTLSPVSLNSVMRHGGVTLQNIQWRSVSQRPVSSADCTLPLTLDLLISKSPGAGSRKLAARLLPAHARPIIIHGSAPLIAPALEVDTLNEIILTGNSVRIEPQIHKLRVNPRCSRVATESGRVSESSFDTIIFCSGIAIGDKSVIVGAAYSDEADRDESASAALRMLVRQLTCDQVALTEAQSSCLKLPDLSRALIDAHSGDVIWRSHSSCSQWEQRGLLIDYLANMRRVAGPADTQRKDTRQLTLITFLRSDTLSTVERQQTRDFKLSDDVRKRLTRVIEGSLVRGNDKTTVSHATRTEGDKRMKSSDLPGESENLSIVDEKSGRSEETQEETREETGKETRHALEIALRHIPRGGYLKLSPINNKGEVRMESFDRDGENTIDITLTDKTFPDSDNIL